MSHSKGEAKHTRQTCLVFGGQLQQPAAQCDHSTVASAVYGGWGGLFMYTHTHTQIIF